jgi:hypothetical protein
VGSAGYSGTPLPKKLEIKANTRVATVGAPADFDQILGDLPAGSRVRKGIAGARDLTIWFVTSRRQLEGESRRRVGRAASGSRGRRRRPG